MFTTLRRTALSLSILFLGIVLIERVPGVLLPTEDPYEWLMFGLFKISLLDDVTHGISGLLGLLALWYGKRWIVKYLILIGGYYTLDALFFFTTGILTGQGIVANILLNGPHILIALVIGRTLKRSIRSIELHPHAE